MTISSALSTHGLYALATPTGTLTGNDVRIGELSGSTLYTDADVVYSMLAFFPDAVSELNFNLFSGSTSGSTAWVAGTAQVETAGVVAASGITGNGNATVTVTAAGMTGSPKAISVALTTTTHTTATLIATAIAAALNLDADYSAMFTATSSSANVITTRKAVTTTTIGSLSIPRYAANDGTLNVAIANGTCTGITTAATSSNTTAGVVTSGIKIYDGEGLDFEGVTLPEIDTLYGWMIKTGASGSIIFLAGGSYPTIIGPENIYLWASATSGVACLNPDTNWTATADAGGAYAYITVIGRTT